MGFRLGLGLEFMREVVCAHHSLVTWCEGFWFRFGVWGLGSGKGFRFRVYATSHVCTLFVGNLV